MEKKTSLRARKNNRSDYFSSRTSDNPGGSSKPDRVVDDAIEKFSVVLGIYERNVPACSNVVCADLSHRN